MQGRNRLAYSHRRRLVEISHIVASGPPSLHDIRTSMTPPVQHVFASVAARLGISAARLGISCSTSWYQCCKSLQQRNTSLNQCPHVTLAEHLCPLKNIAGKCAFLADWKNKNFKILEDIFFSCDQQTWRSTSKKT